MSQTYDRHDDKFVAPSQEFNSIHNNQAIININNDCRHQYLITSNFLMYLRWLQINQKAKVRSTQATSNE